MGDRQCRWGDGSLWSFGENIYGNAEYEYESLFSSEDEDWIEGESINCGYE